MRLKSSYYYTGRKCVHGHRARRYTGNGGCAACRTENNQKWAEKNWNWYKKRNAMKLWVRTAYHAARLRALAKGLPFRITKDDIEKVTPARCPVFGTRFRFTGNRRPTPESATLDRIVPAKGYVRGNIAVISARANLIKSNATLTDIFRVAEWLREFTEKIK